jgi:predicted N-acyltransferase
LKFLSARDIGEPAWNACANPAGARLPHPFTRYEFFAALEESGSAGAETGWLPAHIVEKSGADIVGLLPAYVKNHSYGEYVFDHGWAEAFERAGGNYYPKLQCSVPFTPVTGRRLLARDRRNPAIENALLDSSVSLVEKLGASSSHVTFLTEPEAEAARSKGFLLRHDSQFHWLNRGYTDFSQFLGDLSSAKRKTLRKEREAIRAAGIAFDWVSGRDITEAHWDAFFDFYMDTGSRKWGSPYLTREFFSRLGQGMSEQVLLIFARKSGRYVGGALNLFGEGTLFGRNWGCSEYVPFLHFETCYYQAIDYAIACGLQRVEAGAQGSHKLLRGYVPVQTCSAHYIVHPGLRRAVSDYLDDERRAVAENVQALAEHAPFKKGN